MNSIKKNEIDDDSCQLIAEKRKFVRIRKHSIAVCFLNGFCFSLLSYNIVSQPSTVLVNLLHMLSCGMQALTSLSWIKYLIVFSNFGFTHLCKCSNFSLHRMITSKVISMRHHIFNFVHKL